MAIPAVPVDWSRLDDRTGRLAEALFARIVEQDTKIAADVSLRTAAYPKARARELDIAFSSDFSRFVRMLDERNPCLGAMMGDTLSALNRRLAAVHQGRVEQADHEDVARLLQIAIDRVDTVEPWDFAHNATLRAILSGNLSPGDISPHPRCPSGSLDQTDRSEDCPSGDGLLSAVLNDDVTDVVRKTHAVHLMEVLLALLDHVFPGKKIRWVDLARGPSPIPIAVDMSKYCDCDFEVVGVDLRQSDIASAGSTATGSTEGNGRRNVLSDVQDAIGRIRKEPDTLAIVSMFEFLDHVEDPLGFLKGLSQLPLTLTVIGSPLDRRPSRPDMAVPTREEPLWTFGRAAFEDMLTLCGGKLAYSSEIRIGAYVDGLDWLTVVGSDAKTRRALRSVRRESR